MSTFAEWKKRCKLLYSMQTAFDDKFIMQIAQSAYKSGERQGRKDAEEIARRAIELRALLDSRK